MDRKKVAGCAEKKKEKKKTELYHIILFKFILNLN